MQKTVKEIIDMINAGKLQYNQSTQRKFIYADLEVQLDCGKTTKAGSVIHSILEYGIQLPAVYFWDNTETKQLNIHDGKQRLLSLYYFINPTPAINFTTIRNGKSMNFVALSAADQAKLLDYKFDVVYRAGTSAEEEQSFDLINTNSVNLTQYECLSGMFHGTFLTGFENFVEHCSKTMDQVKPINRGEQAYKLLLAMFSIADSKKAPSADKSRLLLNDRVRPLRQTWFDPKAFCFDEILQVFNEFARATKIKEDRAIAVATYIVRKGYDADDIINLYRKSMKGINDISSWDIDTHKTFIDYFVDSNYSASLDPQRNFSKDVKDELYARSNRCAYVDASGVCCSETNYSKLEVDHITPWSKGGRTILANAQLLCKHHNTSKGNRP
jgi:hypothetical protein